MTLQFANAHGEIVPLCTYSEWRNRLDTVTTEEGLNILQVIEGCGFSMAMVVRYALGLSAQGGVVTSFVSDTMFGWIVLATTRHLLNSGSEVNVVVPCSAENPAALGMHSEVGSGLLKAVLSRGGKVIPWTKPDWSAVAEDVERSHNVLCGLSDSCSKFCAWQEIFISEMNESAVPVHVVGAPMGVDLCTGAAGPTRLYASSTLSLGLPLYPLTSDPDLIGRHYLADAGWSLGLYRQHHYAGVPLFSEQPVIKLGSAPETAS